MRLAPRMFANAATNERRIASCLRDEVVRVNINMQTGILRQYEAMPEDLGAILAALGVKEEGEGDSPPPPPDADEGGRGDDPDH